MRKSIVLLAGTAALAACGRSADNAEANSSANGAVNSAAPEAAKPAYCFFQDSETRSWKAKVDANGNVVVSGEAYREDPRYKALLSPATVSGTKAEVSPTITQNDTGFAAPQDWWPLKQTIPGSTSVTSVTVKCGDKTLATLAVPRTK